MRSIACLLLCATAAAGVAAAQASIELLPQASVASAAVVLGDVARLHATDLGVMRTLVNLPVGRAPHAGEVALLQRADLAQWVRRRSGIAPDAVEWSGAQQTRVLRTVPRLRGEEIARAAVEAARARLAATGRSGVVHARGRIRDLDVPEGALRLEVRGLDEGDTARRLLAWVDVWADRAFVRTVPILLQVADAMQSRDAPDAAPLPRADSAPVTKEREPAPLAVARGEWALLRLAEGGITLESRVEVLQDGRAGQRIRVRAQSGAGPLFARVLGPGQLELSP